ncbi:hypothetical protein [Planobispora takensis]|nr:hypothetical protein [Planobispora takensis]
MAGGSGAASSVVSGRDVSADGAGPLTAGSGTTTESGPRTR